jgi:hypothetical protein
MAQEIADSKLIDTWSSGGNIVEPDISKIIEGWQLGEQPPHEYMNWLQNTFGSKLNHILKNGVATWNNETEYLAGSSVQHNGNVWLCKTTNTNSEPADVNANWKRIITVESLTTVLGGYVDTTSTQTIAGVKTFSSNPLSTATQSTNSNALTKYSAVVKNTGDETIAGVKTFSSSPIVPAPTTGTQAANKAYVDTKVSKPELVTLTGSATFNGTTQNINLTNIGNITLAIGDVIEVTGTISNNKLFTVESIVDNNNIVVNYEHRGTSAPVPTKRLITKTETATITLYNRAKDAPLGQGQDWCIVTDRRTIGVENTNNTKRAIQILSHSTRGVNLDNYSCITTNTTGDDFIGIGFGPIPASVSFAEAQMIVPADGKYTYSLIANKTYIVELR